MQSGDFVFNSGQISLDPRTGNLPATVAGQTTLAMENIRTVLQEAGLNFSDVVQTKIYLTDMQDFETVNGTYQQCFGSDRPARAMVKVSGLPKGVTVEIEIVARWR